MQSEETLSLLAALDRDVIENAIKDICDLQVQGRFDALERYLAPGAEFRFLGDPRAFPYAGLCVGKKNIIGFYRRFHTEIEFLDHDVTDCIVEGERAFSRRVVSVVHRGTSLGEQHEIWDLWRFRNGLVMSSVKLLDISAYDRMQGH